MPILSVTAGIFSVLVTPTRRGNPSVVGSILSIWQPVVSEFTCTCVITCSATTGDSRGV